MASDRSDEATLEGGRDSDEADRREGTKAGNDKPANDKQSKEGGDQYENKRGEDGVRVENGVPVLGLKGEDDPLSLASFWKCGSVLKPNISDH